MTKARDLANIISGGFTADDIPNIDASKITTGTFADARISASSVSQHATSFDDNKIVNDISTLALRQASDQNKSAYSTGSSSVDVFQDATGIDTTSDVVRNDNEYVYSASLQTDTNLLELFDLSSQSTGTPTQYISGLKNNLQLNTYPSYGLSIVADNPFSGNCMQTAPNGWGSADGGSYIQWKSGATGSFASTGAFTIEFWLKPLSGWQATNHYFLSLGTSTSGEYIFYGHNGTSADTITNITNITNNGTALSWNDFSTSTWSHVAIVRDSSGNVATFKDGVRGRYGSSNTQNFSGGAFASTTMGRIGMYATDQYSAKVKWDLLRISTNAKYDPTQSTYTVPTSKFTTQSLEVASTGNFTGTTITAPSSVSSMGAIITYQDNAGTNALNTDIVLQLSADGGSNWSTATLTALPNFSTGIKMAKVNDLAVTPGTQLKYRLNFANQASGTKEARIRGVALQY